jgi:hypothetical protein
LAHKVLSVAVGIFLFKHSTLTRPELLDALKQFVNTIQSVDFILLEAAKNLEM